VTYSKLLVLACTFLLSFAAAANPDTVKKELEKKYPEVKAERITKAGYGELYEVFANGEILYTDEKVTYLLLGTLVDASNRDNVTESRLQKLTAINFNDLPFQQAIKLVRGNGSRKMAIFEDPNCGYCKRLAKELLKLDNVTVYVFLYPILSEDSVRKSKQIWCAADRSKAWNDWMIDGKAPAGREDCDTSAVTKNQEFGRKLNISGTPTIFFADGERVPGAVPLARIEQKLNQVK